MEQIVPFAFLCGFTCDYWLHRRFHTIRCPCTFLLSLAAYTLLWKAFDNQLLVVKGLIFVQILIVAGYYDARTHDIPDCLSVLILLDGLILIEPRQALIGFFIVSLPLLLIGKITGGGVGGGDIKLIAASGFVLGTYGAVIGTIVGMIVFLAIYLIFYRKKLNKMYAMAPYLGIGCFFAYLMMN